MRAGRGGAAKSLLVLSALILDDKIGCIVVGARVTSEGDEAIFDEPLDYLLVQPSVLAEGGDREI